MIIKNKQCLRLRVAAVWQLETSIYFRYNHNTITCADASNCLVWGQPREDLHQIARIVGRG